jgi:hypothetical protein
MWIVTRIDRALILGSRRLRARGQTQQQTAELLLNRRDGEIRSRNSHEHDPNPPKG